MGLGHRNLDGAVVVAIQALSFRSLALFFELLLIAALIAVATIRYYVDVQAQSLQDMQETGVIRVLISDEPDSQYVFNKRHYGFEYEMLSRFAEHLELQLDLKVVPFAELFSLLDSGVGDIAVGGILLNPYVERVSQPTIPWFQQQTTVVYRRGTERPITLEQLGAEPVLGRGPVLSNRRFRQAQFKGRFSFRVSVTQPGCQWSGAICPEHQLPG